MGVLFVYAQVLQTGQEINEIDNTGFSTHQPTVYAGNLGNNRFVVQVTTISVKLLQGAVQLQHVPMDLGSPIVLVSRLVVFLRLWLSESGQLQCRSVYFVNGGRRSGDHSHVEGNPRIGQTSHQ